MIIRWRESKRRHDDVHWPMQGRGKRATPPKAPRKVKGPTMTYCPYCGGSESYARSGSCKRAGVPECKHPCMTQSDTDSVLQEK